MDRKAVEPDPPESMVKAVGRRIAELRRLEGYTQLEFTIKSGIGHKAYQRIEAGTSPALTLAKISEVADALGYDVEVNFTKRW